MKIYSIGNISNTSFINKSNNTVRNNRYGLLSRPKYDEVSFSGKNYDSESIINPTYHCAYCGCRVYTEKQMKSIIQEILSSKSSRLQDKIKGIIEKLSEGRNAPEISEAKKIKNADEINFFEKFLEISQKKPFLKGEEIFQQVYNIGCDEAEEMLKTNMHPVMRTIDHTSPQNLSQDNNNVDLNLVEACSCCNQHLKDGVTFDVFYKMFPSIKNNMPKEKFDFAMAQLLESSQKDIKQRMSAAKILKHIECLFEEKNEAAAYLNSINYKIQSCESDIKDAIDECETDIGCKHDEITELEAKLQKLQSDGEYQAILARSRLKSSFDVSSSAISELKSKCKRISTLINELENGNTLKKTSRNKQKKQNKQKKLTEEQKQAQISELNAQLAYINERIEAEMLNSNDLKLKLDILNKEYPTIEMYQYRKNMADKVCNSYIALGKEKKNNSVLNQALETVSQKEGDLASKIASFPSGEFKAENYSEREQADYEIYCKLKEALSYIETHPNGGYVKAFINQTALIQINQEIQAMELQPVIIEYNKIQQRKSLEEELAKIRNEKNSILEQIKNSDKRIQDLNTAASVMTLAEAQSKSLEASNAVKRLTEKQNLVKIPHRISTLKAEIMLLKTTINELQSCLARIEQSK